MFFSPPNEVENDPKGLQMVQKGVQKGSKLTLSKYCVHKWARIEGGAQLILATPVFSLQSIQPLKAPRSM